MLATIIERPHLPLGHLAAFFLVQLEGGLHFPLHPFFCDISTYFSLPLNKLAPNSW